MGGGGVEMLFQGGSFCQDSLGSGWALEISVDGTRGGEGKEGGGRRSLCPDQELSFSRIGLLGAERQHGGSK